MREDVPLCVLLLAHCSPEDLNMVNEDHEGSTALHISCSLGNIVITQLLIWVRLKYGLSRTHCDVKACICWHGGLFRLLCAYNGQVGASSRLGTVAYNLTNEQEAKFAAIVNPVYGSDFSKQCFKMCEKVKWHPKFVIVNVEKK